MHVLFPVGDSSHRRDPHPKIGPPEPYRRTAIDPTEKDSGLSDPFNRDFLVFGLVKRQQMIKVRSKVVLASVALYLYLVLARGVCGMKGKMRMAPARYSISGILNSRQPLFFKGLREL